VSRTRVGISLPRVSLDLVCVCESCHYMRMSSVTHEWVLLHLNKYCPMSHMNGSCQPWMSHVTHTRQNLPPRASRSGVR